jgi:8-oxo-dGTP pyrophosphatase MutT (NUDIX family)
MAFHENIPGWQLTPSDVKFWKNTAFGGVLFDDEGRILLRKPKGNFGGYHWTFAKGRKDTADEDPVAAAIREVAEETGHKAVPVGVINGAFNANTKSFFFVMKSTGHNPALMDSETEEVRWVTPEEAAKLIGETTNKYGLKRDLKLLEAAVKAKDQLLQDGKWVPPAKPSAPMFLPPKTPPKPKAEVQQTAPADAAVPRTSGFPSDLRELAFEKELGGSTMAKLYRDPATGRRFVVKGGATPEQAAEEHLAGELYRKLGVPVPKSVLLLNQQGKPTLVSEFVEGQTFDVWKRRAKPEEIRELHAQLGRGFVADALLANWDVAGIDDKNVIVTPEGKAVRIDLGGSLRFRAMGSPKTAAEFGPEVRELQTLRDPKVNRTTAAMFAHLSDGEISALIREVLEKDSDLLAAVPAALRPTIAARLETLRGHLGVKAGVGVTAEQIRKARLNGMASLSNSGDVEDNQIIWWEETNADGEKVLKAWFKLTEEAERRLVDKWKPVPLAPTAGQAAALPSSKLASIQAMLNGAWNEVLAAAKSHNHHVAAGSKANQAKVAAMEAAVSTMAASYAKGDITPGSYLQFQAYVKQLQDGLKLGKATGILPAANPLTAKLAPSPAATAPVAAPAQPAATGGLTAKPVEWLFYTKDISKGHGRETRNLNVDTAGKLPKIRAAEIRDGDAAFRWAYDDTPKRRDADNSATEMSHLGLSEITVKGGATEANIAKALAIMDKAGVSIRAASDAQLEFRYIKANAYAAGKLSATLEPASRAAWLKVEAEPDMEKRRTAARAFVKTHLGFTPPEKPTPGVYDWRGKGNTFGEGWRHFERFDLGSAAELAKSLAGYKLTHESSDPMNFFKGVIESGGQITATIERYRKGISVRQGWSVGSDRRSGGGVYFYTRLRKNAVSYTATLVQPESLVRRLDALHYGEDFYGRTNREGFVEQNRAKTVAQMKEFSKAGGNEFDLKNGSDGLGPGVYWLFETPELVKTARDFARANGYATWPDGRKIEDVIMWRYDYKKKFEQ